MARAGLDFEQEIDVRSSIRDISPFGVKMSRFLRIGSQAATTVAGIGMAGFIFPAFSELAFLGATGVAAMAFSTYRRTGLPMQVPASANYFDPKEIDLGTKKPGKGKGIVFIGNDRKTGEEIWLTDTQARTHMMFLGTTGSGKAQPLDAQVLTPGGWRRMGDIQPGMTIVRPDGGTALVSQVFPQGSLEIFQITFADGRHTEACGDHLWEVVSSRMRKPMVLNTRQIVDGMKEGASYRVPLIVPAPGEDLDLPVAPYLMGALLGGADLKHLRPRFKIDEPELRDEIKRRSSLQTGGVGRHLLGLGLLKCSASRKFVPAVYLQSSAKQRLALLQGLMDTRGYVASERECCEFTTTSQQLASDVQTLVRSLGGTAGLRTFTSAEGRDQRHRPSYAVQIRIANPDALFSLARKREAARDLPAPGSLLITHIESIGRKEAQCIYIDDPRHLYVTDDFIVTHNTEFLISVVFNGLIHGSGLIYTDGKADNSLYGKIYSMARLMGREDDVLLINFQTGAKDIYGAQPRKISNTLNPFAVGSSGMLSQLVVGLMSGGKEGGKSDVWENRAISFVEGLLKPLVFLRDRYGLLLDVEVIRNYFNLEPLVALLMDNMMKVKNDFGAEEWHERPDAKYPGIGMALSGLAAYIDNLPGFNFSKPVNKQESVVSEQHGYITMQLIRTFNSLADTYGYIMKTPLAEIDFLDVFINRRILVVLLPALEKSPPELTNLGRIVVAAIKATMAVGLGADVEGEWSKVIDAKPTTAPSPYMCMLDEYGYYAIEGFAIVPAQARSLGFSAIFAGQDLPAFEKASQTEAKSTLGNTTTKFCGKLECTTTYEYFKASAGEGVYSKASGFQNQADSILSSNYLDNQSAQFERMSRVSLDDLKSQVSGEWHMFFADRIVRINSFFANPPKVKHLRTNHFLQIAPPDDRHARLIDESVKRYRQGMVGEFMIDRTPSADLITLVKAFRTEAEEGAEGDEAAVAARAPEGMEAAAQVIATIYRKVISASNVLESHTSPFNDVASAEEDLFDEMCEIEDPTDEVDQQANNIDFSAVADADEFDNMIFGSAFTGAEDGGGRLFRSEREGILATADIGMGASGGDATTPLPPPPPAAPGSGLLERNAVAGGLAEIERRVGRNDSVAATLGSASAGILAETTHYCAKPPVETMNVDDFLGASDGLIEELGLIMDMVDSTDNG